MKIVSKLLSLPFYVSSFVMGGFVDPAGTTQEVTKLADALDADFFRDEQKFAEQETRQDAQARSSTTYWQKKWDEKRERDSARDSK